MKFSKLTLGLAAAALAATPALAQMVNAPVVAPLAGDESELEGGEKILIGIFAAAAVIGGIIIIADDDDADLPISG